MERITVTDHARWEATRRGIDEATVLRVARRPEQAVQVRPGREVRQSRVELASGSKTYLVRVIVDVAPKLVTVVTVYRTSKVEKYWRQP